MRKSMSIAVGVAAAGVLVALGAAIKGMASTGILHDQTVSADASMLHGLIEVVGPDGEMIRVFRVKVDEKAGVFGHRVDVTGDPPVSVGLWDRLAGTGQFEVRAPAGRALFVFNREIPGGKFMYEEGDIGCWLPVTDVHLRFRIAPGVAGVAHDMFSRSGLAYARSNRLSYGDSRWEWTPGSGPKNLGEALLCGLQDGDPENLAASVVAAGSGIEPANSKFVDPLIGALKSDKERTRRDAARALGIHGDARAVAPLITALGDADLEVQQRAIVALSEIHDPRAIEPLIALEGANPALAPWTRSALERLQRPAR